MHSPPPPPFDAIRAVLAVAVAGRSSDPKRSARGGGFQPASFDISRAHLYVPTRRRRDSVRFPPGTFESGGGDEQRNVGLLRRTMYGTLDAAAGWHRHHCDILRRADCEKGAVVWWWIALASVCRFSPEGYAADAEHL